MLKLLESLTNVSQNASICVQKCPFTKSKAGDVRNTHSADSLLEKNYFRSGELMVSMSSNSWFSPPIAQMKV